ncbi:DUF4236 domain-containing protein [Bradyrhizobium genosp. SA-3]|uniref:DUF4236 domain-containing protein n=1 Tax=Bradyrhizobium genosp. SA-3 TaxID=508868 RepID=UPI003D9BE625
MSFRFRRSFKTMPGVHLNLRGSGACVSLGSRGLHYTCSLYRGRDAARRRDCRIPDLALREGTGASTTIELPICLYGEIDLRSCNEVNERIQCSRVEAAERFVAFPRCNVCLRMRSR